MGVFQFASPLAISVITKMKPQNIEDLSAANAFIRPGASGLEEYMAAKLNPAKRRKMAPDLDKHLAVTHGAIVYQEQIMSLIAEVMSIDFGEADQYRRILEKAGKPENAKKIADWKIDFSARGLTKGYSQKLVDLLVNLIIENSGYGFNKSHAVSYSIISYWTAYMKANYPLVFYTAMLNGNLDEAEAFMSEANKLGIQVLPPHINDSQLGFSIDSKNNIRAGFNAVKGVGPKAVDSIMTYQPFTSVDDFFARNEKAAVNKGVVGALIKAGAFEDMGIQIEEDDIPVELNDNFVFTEINGDKYAVLNREQMKKWNEYLTEMSSKKTVAKYLVPPELIPGKYFDKYELVEEKDGSGIVLPEDILSKMKIDLSSLPDQNKTRKKAKGSFDGANDPLKKIPVFRKPFILHHRELANVKVNYMDMYLQETEDFGFSFLPHPLEKHMDKIQLFEDIEDDQVMVTAGIVTSVIQRKTKTGKPFYWVMIKTPRDSVRITLWDNVFAKHKNYLNKNDLVLVKGTRGYGGITPETIRPLKVKKD